MCHVEGRFLNYSRYKLAESGFDAVKLYQIMRKKNARTRNIAAAKYFVINASIYSSQINLHVIGFNGFNTVSFIRVSRTV